MKSKKIKGNQTNRSRIVIIITVFVLLLVLAGFFLFQRKNTTSGTKIVTPSPEVTVTSQSSSAPTQAQEVQGNIRVSSPLPDEIIYLPVVIRGKARVFENQFNYRIRDANRTILTEGSASTNAADAGEFGDFTISIASFTQPTESNGTIEVFDYSAKDGSEIDKVSIPVRFANANNLTVKAYFSRKNTGGTSCDDVYPVDRQIVRTKRVARAALEELLKGPTDVEKQAGYVTNINQDVKIQKLTIVSGVARADFSDTLEKNVAGSCRVEAIRSQIIHTLKQFPTVQSVIISINGRTDDILQP